MKLRYLKETSNTSLQRNIKYREELLKKFLELCLNMNIDSVDYVEDTLKTEYLVKTKEDEQKYIFLYSR